ncbi:hypothetical protein B0686_09430 [Streptococcus mitis]|uniref:Uncharacterized protein n=1 Tax=Streptococcus mitis TaxID=28037 RepID=A0A1T0C488_STRMT|nr:hypothetical protein B0686_09430 [Streptococcus mitis]
MFIWDLVSILLGWIIFFALILLGWIIFFALILFAIIIFFALIWFAIIKLYEVISKVISTLKVGIEYRKKLRQLKNK